MGCINSTKKLNELKRNDNVFRVRVVRLQPDSRSGFLELTPRELIFAASSESVVWALQHLRRYGLNGDIFSFEAGRRCMTGPGIYTFRCQQADRLYHLFQRYVNAVSLVTDEAFVFADRDHPSHTLFRPEPNPHGNNYLEPAPLAGAVHRAAMHESFSSSPLSLDLDSPDSVPSLSFTNEVVHFQNHLPPTPGTYVYTNASASSNVYLEQPFRAQSEHNNNVARGSIGAFNTLPRNTFTKRTSLDMPPEECAPLLTGNSEALHMYANVEGMGSSSMREREREKALDAVERCYENLSRLDLPLTSCQREAIHEQFTPGTINYIVLDLDQPRSPAQSSPKTCFGSGLSLTPEKEEHTFDNVYELQTLPTALTTTVTTFTTATTTTTTTKQEETKTQQQKTESSLGYSTIDFVKTCALIKSSTHGADFDTDHDQEESRITRHSKCVRKAYSISE